MAQSGALISAGSANGAYDSGIFKYDLANADKVASGVASAATGANKPAGAYCLIASADAWLTYGATPTAAAGVAGNFFLKSGIPFYLFLDAPAKMAAIQDAAAGNVMIFPIAAVA